MPKADGLGKKILRSAGHPLARLTLKMAATIYGTEGDVEKKRKFLGVHYKCCNVYARAYMNREKTAYTGGCPSCGKRVEVKIGPGGTDSRFFDAH